MCDDRFRFICNKYKGPVPPLPSSFLVHECIIGICLVLASLIIWVILSSVPSLTGISCTFRAIISALDYLKRWINMTDLLRNLKKLIKNLWLLWVYINAKFLLFYFSGNPAWVLRRTSLIPLTTLLLYYKQNIEKLKIF